MGAGATTVAYVKWLVDRIVDPLRADETITHFTLAIPEAQTTTVDSVQGWANRPPAVLRCPGCGTEIDQPTASGAIDCPYCYREFAAESFGDLELLELTCPRCDLGMDFGTRHPKLFDVPEWATCRNCQYHWDLNHWF
jgi:hypothetical protein